MAKTQVSTKKKVKKKKTVKKGESTYNKKVYSHGQDFFSCYTEEAWEYMNSEEF